MLNAKQIREEVDNAIENNTETKINEFLQGTLNQWKWDKEHNTKDSYFENEWHYCRNLAQHITGKKYAYNKEFKLVIKEV